MKWSFVAKLTCSFFVAAATLAVAAFFCIERAASIASEAQSQSQPEAVLALSDQLLEQLRQSEAGQQGYIITADSLYLASYSNAVGQIGLTIRQLYGIPGRSAALNSHLSSLDTLFTKKFHEFNVSIQVRREKDRIQPAADVIRKTKGRANTDNIRTTIASIVEEQRALIRTRQDRIIADSGVILFAAFGAGLGALLLMLVLAILMSASLRSSLANVAASVEQFALGDLFHRAPQQKAPETNAIVTALNAMVTSLQERQKTMTKANSRAVETLNASVQGMMTLRAVRSPRGEVADFEITFINPAAASMLGVQVYATQGARLLAITPEPARDTFFKQATSVVESAAPLTAQHALHNNGQQCTILANATKYGDGVTMTLAQ